MLSESARMSSAAEARFRVQAPNSKPRAIKVIALDAASEPVLQRLAGARWEHTAFFRVSSGNGGSTTSHSGPTAGTLTDLAGHSASIQGEVSNADLVIMLASPGGHAEAAALVGQACSLRRVMTTTLIVGNAASTEEALSRTLVQVRPWSLMLVIARTDDYLTDMMSALRA
jgi:hypothetical protein